MLLHEVVDGVARSRPGALAVVHGEVALTYGDLAARIRRTATTVAAVSEPGARIAVIGENHPVWIEAMYGVPAAGRVLVFLNHRLAPAEIESVLERSGSTALIGSEVELERLHRIRLPDQVWSFGDWSVGPEEAGAGRAPAGFGSARPAGFGSARPAGFGSARPASEGRSVGDEAAAWLIYTSGTTARPKGAVLTHRSLLAAVEVTAAARPVADGDVYLFPFPLCHVAAYNVVHHHLRGRPVVLIDRFEPGAFVEACARWGATSTSVAATMLSALLELAEEDEAARRGLTSLRSVAYGAAPMPEPILRRADALLAPAFAQGYGMTELSGNAVFLGPEEHRRGLTGSPWLLAAAGKPGPGVGVRIVDDDLNDLPTGTPGEILVRGEQVMAGYWEDPGQTADALVDGWLRTGDVGRRDDDGWLYVVDRKKDVIVSGGENVSSREVEDVLLGCAGVREVAVVAVPDPRWGENVCAVVVPTSGADFDPDALVRAARDRLAGFKVPRHVVVRDALPRNGSGKIVKAELRAWLTAHPEVLGPRR